MTPYSASERENGENICLGCCKPMVGNIKMRYEFNHAVFCCKTCHDENYVAEEVQVDELVENLRSEWKLMKPGIDTCYTFEGELGKELLLFTRCISRLTADLTRARELLNEARECLEVFVWCAEQDKSAKAFVATTKGRSLLDDLAALEQEGGQHGKA